MKGFLSLQRRFSSYSRKNLTIYSLTEWFPYGKKIIICCLGEYFEVSGITDDLDDKKFVRPNIVNSVVEGSYY